jgi:subtilisin family serine protease
MHHSVLGLVISVLLSSSPSIAQSIDAGWSEGRLGRGERVRVLVEFNAATVNWGTENTSAEAFANREAVRQNALANFFETFPRYDQNSASMPGPRLVHEYRMLPMAALNLNRAEISYLESVPGVRRVSVDIIDHIFAGNRGAIQADAVVNNGLTGQGRTIAILDTGVDRHHPDLTDSWIAGGCFSSTVEGQSESFCEAAAASDTISNNAGDNCNELSDDPVSGAEGCFHGTAIASVAAGSNGIAPGAGIIGVQVFSRFLGNEFCEETSACALSYLSDQVAALDWLYTNREALGVSVINMSLGGGRYERTCNSDPRAYFINLFRAEGVPTVIATGNDGWSDSVSAPACIEGGISVTSWQSSGGAFGGGKHSDYANVSLLADLSAPGMAEVALPLFGPEGAPRYVTSSGTSIAAPHVAGAIALIQEAQPNATVDEIEHALITAGPQHPFYRVVASPAIRDEAVVLDIPFVYVANALNLLETRQQAADTEVGVLSPPMIRLEGLNGFGNSSNRVQLEIQNSGLSDAVLAISSNQQWLNLELVGGEGEQAAISNALVAAGSSAFLNITASTTGLEYGRHTATITFEDTGGIVSRLLVVLRVWPAVPPNDAFDEAFSFSEASFTTAFNNHIATVETDEPASTSFEGRGSIWWHIQPRRDVGMVFSADTDDFPFRMNLFSGDALSNLTPIADIAGPAGTDGTNRTYLSASLVSGESYYIAIGSDGDDDGSGTFLSATLGNPPNDDWADAIELSGDMGRVFGSTRGATLDIDDPNHTGYSDNSVWYRWTASRTGNVAVRNFDTSGLNIYRYNGPDSTPTYVTSRFASAEDGTAYAVFQAEQGTAYLFKPFSAPDGEFELFWHYAQPNPYWLNAAVLPTSRSVVFGETATFFATIINGHPHQAATNCRVESPYGSSLMINYAPTDAEDNTISGAANVPVDIPPGESQSFVLSMRAVEIEANPVSPFFRCDNFEAYRSAVNAFTLTTTAIETADILAVTATPSSDGILTVPLNGVAAFSLAAVNIGSPATVTLESLIYSLPLALAVSVEFCETNPSTGRCITDRSAQLPVHFARNDARTFTAFVRSAGSQLQDDPSAHRIYLRFSSTGSQTNASSIAIQTR